MIYSNSSIYLLSHMANINLNSIKQLKPNYSKWSNPKTCTIRIPENLKNQVLEYAHKLDQSQTNIQLNPTVTQDLINVLAKIESKEKGYKSNSAGQLIKDIKNIINEVSNGKK